MKLWSHLILVIAACHLTQFATAEDLKNTTTETIITESFPNAVTATTDVITISNFSGYNLALQSCNEPSCP